MRFTCKKSRAQLFAIETLIALAAFAGILLLFETAWGSATARVQDDGAPAYAVLQRLVYTPGAPANWSRSGSASIGIASAPNVIDAAKLRELVHSNYSQAKQALGAGIYEAYASVSYTDGTVATVDGMGHLGGIAYTNAKGNADEGSAAKYGLRDWMTGANMTFVNYSSSWQALLANISNYSTVVFEDPHLNKGDLSGAQQAALKNWVSAGGNYLQKEHGNLIEIFGPSTASAEDRPALVVAVDPLLKGASIGDNATFEEGYMLTGSNITTYIKDRASSGAMVASLKYGNGTVYYLPDTQGSVSGSASYNNTRAIMNFFGKPAEFGPKPAGEGVAYVARGIALYAGSRVVVRVVLWR